MFAYICACVCVLHVYMFKCVCVCVCVSCPVIGLGSNKASVKGYLKEHQVSRHNGKKNDIKNKHELLMYLHIFVCWKRNL